MKGGRIVEKKECIEYQLAVACMKYTLTNCVNVMAL